MYLCVWTLSLHMLLCTQVFTCVYSQSGAYIYKAYTNGHPYDTSKVSALWFLVVLFSSVSLCIFSFLYTGLGDFLQ